MRVLVTGANGFVGNALIARLQLDGDKVLGTVRKTPLAGQIAIGDINETTDWSPALNGIEVVIHTAARVHQMKDSTEISTEFHRVNVIGTLSLAKQAAQAGVRRFIFISSIKAMGEYGHFHAKDDCHPQDAYGISKRNAEIGLLEIAQKTGMELVILRLPLVYGPRVKANFLRLIHLIEKSIPIPFGMVKNARSFIGLTNLVDVITTCIHHPVAAGKIYLVSDNQDVSTPELILVIAKALNRKVRFIPIPPFLIKAAALIIGKKEFSKRLLASLTVDISPIQQELNWQPPLTLQEGLVETISWYKSK